VWRSSPSCSSLTLTTVGSLDSCNVVPDKPCDSAACASTDAFEKVICPVLELNIRSSGEDTGEYAGGFIRSTLRVGEPVTALAATVV